MTAESKAVRTLTVLFALGVLAAAHEACGDPLRYPKRMMDGQAVDLDPLFRWWNKPRGARPLTAWVHVTGPIVATNGWGWTVNALIEDTPDGKKGDRRAHAAAAKPGKIVLKNPPIEDLAQFETLKAQLKALNREHDRQSAEVEQARQHVREISDRKDINRRNRARARSLAQESKRWSQAENDAKARMKTTDKQIQDVNSKLAGYSNRSKYAVDCLALKVSQTYLNLPVYDCGAIIKLVSPVWRHIFPAHNQRLTITFILSRSNLISEVRSTPEFIPATPILVAIIR